MSTLASRLTELINENAAVTRFSYDVLDRLIEEVGFDGSMPFRVELDNLKGTDVPMRPLAAWPVAAG